MKYITLILLLITTTSCDNVVQDSPFLKYELEVASELGIKQEHLYIPILFSKDLTGNTNAICRLHITKDYGVQILVNRDKWTSMDEPTRLGLIAHEMMHCYHGYAHVEHPIHRYGTLMSPYTSDSSMCIKELGLSYCIQEAHKHLLDGLLQSLFK